ncbi:hypothetical protein B0H14DRAFT_2618442 [Mycena olivaceomarginata]|nr:hypothetical protein B0H14DRAFT_2618442 [Mycena olivaceomarginata]
MNRSYGPDIDGSLRGNRTDIMEDRDISVSGLTPTAFGDLKQLGQVKSQVLSVGLQIHNVKAQVQNIGAEVRNFRALTVMSLAASHLMVRRVPSVGTKVQQVHQLMHKLSPRNLSEPIFFVMDPLGCTITIQVLHCDSFNDLDRILKAHLHDHPQAGSRYVERGDYSVLSTNGIKLQPFELAGRLRAGIQLEISIIKRRRHRLEPHPRSALIATT